jgi:hypothetical protein
VLEIGDCELVVFELWKRKRLELELIAIY